MPLELGQLAVKTVIQDRERLMSADYALEDDDADDLVGVIERVFGVELEPDETRDWTTLGDIFNTLRRRFQDRALQGACLTGMAFYRLRRALNDQTEALLRPDSDLHALAQSGARGFLRNLRVRTGLDMPTARLTGPGQAGVLAMLTAGALVVLALAGSSLTIAVGAGLLAILAAALFAIDPGALPAAGTTLGELSRRVAEINVGRLGGEGGRIRDEDIWRAIVVAVEDLSDRPAETLRPSTSILAGPGRSA